MSGTITPPATGAAPWGGNYQQQLQQLHQYLQQFRQQFPQAQGQDLGRAFGLINAAGSPPTTGVGAVPPGTPAQVASQPDAPRSWQPPAGGLAASPTDTGGDNDRDIAAAGLPTGAPAGGGAIPDLAGAGANDIARLGAGGGQFAAPTYQGPAGGAALPPIPGLPAGTNIPAGGGLPAAQAPGAGAMPGLGANLAGGRGLPAMSPYQNMGSALPAAPGLPANMGARLAGLGTDLTNPTGIPSTTTPRRRFIA